MSKLKDKFVVKEWEKCCTGMCDDCPIAVKYRKKFGKKIGKSKMKKVKKKALE